MDQYIYICFLAASSERVKSRNIPFHATPVILPPSSHLKYPLFLPSENLWIYYSFYLECSLFYLCVLSCFSCVQLFATPLWWTGRPGVLRFMGSQRVGHDWVTELNWTELNLDCSSPDCSIHEILQARILEWVAMSSSWGSSWPRNWICIS